MLGCGIHLPLRMIETHVAGLASLRLPGFLEREGVPRVAGIAGRVAEHRALLLQRGDLRLVFQPDLVAAAATLHAGAERHR